MTAWTCPVCGGTRWRQRWDVTSDAVENGVDPHAFRPSADRYGEAIGAVVTCATCGHGSLLERPTPEQLATAYAGAADPTSLDEEDGQVATAARALPLLERRTSGRRLLDVGCWTGSFLVAARAAGWDVRGVEPSSWAVDRARERGLDVEHADLATMAPPAETVDVVVLCDVLEHLLDPRDAVRRVQALLAPGGLIYLTVPDAGSAVARFLGRRWWSVLPMHVQHFTRGSLRRLLDEAGFDVVDVRTHPKVFTAGYYADRIAGYSVAASRAVRRLLRLLRLDGREVAPDLRDRMQVVARCRS